jgi:c-di-GMP-binding flagellar brake protein YcgR
MKISSAFCYNRGVKDPVKEKRKFFRHPIQVPLQLRISERVESFSAESRDVSLGGLNFVWPKRLVKGTLLDITIPVKEKLFELRAKVVYSKEDRRSARYSTGVSFVDFPSAFKARLAEEVLQILQYRKSVSQRLGREVSEETAAAEWVRDHASQFPPIS